jgi:hypothetical protein
MESQLNIKNSIINQLTQGSSWYFPASMSQAQIDELVNNHHMKICLYNPTTQQYALPYKAHASGWLNNGFKVINHPQNDAAKYSAIEKIAVPTGIPGVATYKVKNGN